MGEYTAVQKFWKIGGNDLVNVEQDLNYNLRRADDRVRPLVEYVYTELPSISESTLPKDVGFKWYKSATNAIFNYQPEGTIEQDPNASVGFWNTSGFSFDNSYTNYDTGENRVGWSISKGMFRARGRVILGDFLEIPLNTVVDFLSPSGLMPSPNKTRYFTVHGGNASGSNYQLFRVIIPGTGSADMRWEFIKYGANASDSTQRFFSLNDICFPITDA